VIYVVDSQWQDRELRERVARGIRRADREAVSAWLGRESHMPKPVHVMTEDADMAAALKESIASARKRGQ
jgi:hypothetical protein